MEVEHVKAHRTKKERKHMSHFDKFVTEGNETTDELAKGGALLDGGFMAEARAETMQLEREEVYAALQCAASFHCSVEAQAKAERKVDCCGSEEGGNEASNGVVRGSR